MIVALSTDVVIGAVERSKKPALQEIGEQIDEAATMSLVSRNRRSRPGETPTANATGQYSLRNIQSSYDPSTNSVLIGAVRTNTKLRRPLPNLLEFGSRRIAARPTMAPALDKVERAKGIRQAWTGRIGRR